MIWDKVCAKSFLIRLVVSVLLIKLEVLSETPAFTNIFAVEIIGDSTVASNVANKYGFKVLNHLESIGGVYEFESGNIRTRSKRSAKNLSAKLSSDPRVIWVEQQKILERSKRGCELNDMRLDDYEFNDPHFKDQWYLINKGQTGGTLGNDLNVEPVWRKGLSGKGVVVTIVDDGIDHEHPDLKENYDPQASADLNDPGDPLNDPTPDKTNPSNNHGTRCAGAVAALADNCNCGVGVAFNARIGGIRMLDGKVTDLIESRSLSYNNQHIDIYSSSWGPKDNGMAMEGPKRYTRKALENGAKMGRGGKGSVFIWATGNGGTYGDDCNCDGYITSIYSLTIGSVTDMGKSTSFGETCASIMAVVFAHGSHPKMIMTDNQTEILEQVVTTDFGGKCTQGFQGTSSAAPLAAGCIALVLEANSDLTWRDIQHMVAETSVVPSELEYGWVVNGGGYHVNHKFGFGAMDCSRMVEAARLWVLVQQQHNCTFRSDNKIRELRAGQSIVEILKVEGCQGGSTPVERLEHVQVYIQMKHRKRGDISINLTSPYGTTSKLLKVRKLDSSKDGIKFIFMTVHNWGENPNGRWTLVIHDNSAPDIMGDDDKVGELINWALVLYGVQGEFANHERWRSSDGYLSKDGRIEGTNLKNRRTLLLRRELLMQQIEGSNVIGRSSDQGAGLDDDDDDIIHNANNINDDLNDDININDSNEAPIKDESDDDIYKAIYDIDPRSKYHVDIDDDDDDDDADNDHYAKQDKGMDRLHYLLMQLKAINRNNRRKYKRIF